MLTGTRLVSKHQHSLFETTIPEVHKVSVQSPRPCMWMWTWAWSLSAAGHPPMGNHIHIVLVTFRVSDPKGMKARCCWRNCVQVGYSLCVCEGKFMGPCSFKQQESELVML